MLVDGSCQPCLPGTFKPAIGNGECTVCGAGNKFAIGDGSADASLCICKQGYFGADCLPCAAGSYKNSTGSGDCTLCHAGTYQPETAAISSSRCLPCPLGAFSKIVGASSSSVCESCAVGTYSDVTPSTACRPCPANSTSSLGSTSFGSCLWLPGYKRSDTTITQIKTCVCPGVFRCLSTDLFTSG